VIAAAVFVLPAGGGASGSTATARNGEIAFIRKANFYGEGVLHVVNPDGTKARQLVKSGWVRDAAWSPDGKRIAIVDKCAIKVMPAGGGRLRTIVRPRIARNSIGQRFSDCYTAPDWSPDGSRVVLMRCRDASCEFGGSALYVVDVSGRGLRQLTQREHVSGRVWNSPNVADVAPDWSPDGRTILFSRVDVSLPDPPYGNWANHASLYLVNPDGSGLFRLPPGQARSPTWSPDGGRIAFVRSLWTTLPPDAEWTGSLVVMNADGSGERTLVKDDQGGDRDCSRGGWGHAWSADGTKLAYSGICPTGIRLIDPDSGAETRITRGIDRVVSWRPLP